MTGTGLAIGDARITLVLPVGTYCTQASAVRIGDTAPRIWHHPDKGFEATLGIITGMCGAPFVPRNGAGGRPQRFCNANCRRSFHAEGQRGQRAPACSALDMPSAISQPTFESEACEDDNGLVLMGQQDFIALAWGQNGNLLLRQNRLYEGDHELRVSRDYFPRFVKALDVLREAIVDAIRRDEQS
jgi:hypothetical protein